MPSKDQTFALCADSASSTSFLSAEMRVVVPCPHCRLIQFRTRNSMCRRCHKPLDGIEKHFVSSDPATRTPGTAAREDRPEIVNHLGTRVREVRRMRGLSQSKLAQLMKVPRTYISKVEMSRTVPTIATLYRMASALEIEVHYLLCDARLHQRELEAISQDPFLRELAQLVEKLNSQQRAVILRAVREAAARGNSAA